MNQAQSNPPHQYALFQYWIQKATVVIVDTVFKVSKIACPPILWTYGFRFNSKNDGFLSSCAAAIADGGGGRGIAMVNAKSTDMGLGIVSCQRQRRGAADCGLVGHWHDTKAG